MRLTHAVLLLSLVGCSAASSAEPEATIDSDLSSSAPLGPDPRGEAARYPIVLAHGFLGVSGGFADFNARIEHALAADGHVVRRASVPPFGSVAIRSKALAAEIDRVLAETGAKKVNVIAHSMGGLDARGVISTLGYGDRVASLTTISTPHRGSRIADVSLHFVSGQSDEARAAFAKIFGQAPSDVDLEGAFADLSERNAAAFEAAHPDDARVYYQSWAGVSSAFAIPNDADRDACEGKLLQHEGRADLVNPIFVGAMPFVAHGDQSNDGFVLVSSAKHGNFRGCIPGDHADEIGVFHDGAPLDRHTGFDFVRFHRNIAFDLAARGF
jgi:triacylglycerol lipase